MTSGGIFDIESREAKLKNLFEERDAPGFWDDQRGAQAVIDKITLLEKPIRTLEELETSYDDMAVLNELAEEEHDDAAANEVATIIAHLDKELSNFEFRMMLGAPDDPKNAILSINSGAGGTESQDWAQMLLRMYISGSSVVVSTMKKSISNRDRKPE